VEARRTSNARRGRPVRGSPPLPHRVQTRPSWFGGAPSNRPIVIDVQRSNSASAKIAIRTTTSTPKVTFLPPWHEGVLRLSRRRDKYLAGPLETALAQETQDRLSARTTAASSLRGERIPLSGVPALYACRVSSPVRKLQSGRSERERMNLPPLEPSWVRSWVRFAEVHDHD
jgi:hypothetical protein